MLVKNNGSVAKHVASTIPYQFVKDYYKEMGKEANFSIVQKTSETELLDLIDGFFGD